MKSTFTKSANNLEELLKQSDPNADDVAVLIAELSERWDKLNKMDREFIDLMKADVTEGNQEVFNAEFEIIEAYSDRYLKLKTKAERLLTRIEAQSEKSLSVSKERRVSKRKFKMPKI